MELVGTSVVESREGIKETYQEGLESIAKGIINIGKETSHFVVGALPSSNTIQYFRNKDKGIMGAPFFGEVLGALSIGVIAFASKTDAPEVMYTIGG